MAISAQETKLHYSVAKVFHTLYRGASKFKGLRANAAPFHFGHRQRRDGDLAAIALCSASLGFGTRMR
jgi:hypothetical protein